MANAFVYVDVCYVDFVRRHEELGSEKCQVVADTFQCRQRRVGENLLIDVENKDELRYINVICTN